MSYYPSYIRVYYPGRLNSLKIMQSGGVSQLVGLYNPDIDPDIDCDINLIWEYKCLIPYAHCKLDVELWRACVRTHLALRL